MGLGGMVAVLGEAEAMRFLIECERISAANEWPCPACDHRLARHDGLRRCHEGWYRGEPDDMACFCGREG
jgi:hypothetical protein